MLVRNTVNSINICSGYTTFEIEYPYYYDSFANCYSNVLDTATVFSTNDLNFDGAAPRSAALITTTLGDYGPVSARAISIRWQTTDTEILRLLGSDVPGLIVTPVAGTLISDPSGTTRTSSQSSDNTPAAMRPVSSSLTPGAIAGIAIGIFVAIMLILVGWVLLKLVRRRAGPSLDWGTKHGSWVKPELDGRDAYAELEAPSTVAEAAAGHRYPAWEMGAESLPTELE